MKLGINVFVRDKDGHILHTFWSTSEYVLCTTVDASTASISIYNKDYKAMRTLLIYHFDEEDKK